MSLIDFVPIIVTALGAALLFKLRFFFVFHPIKTVRELRHALSSRAARLSMTLALAGTLGIGNIVGVAIGIATGGEGSVLWLLFSSVFAAALKYSESAIATDMKQTGGGMASVLRLSFKRGGRALSSLWAALCLLLAFVMGAALQSSAVVASIGARGLGSAAVSIPFTLAAFAVISFGAEKIERFTAVIIPITAVLYIILCLVPICRGLTRIPAVISGIVKSAFTPTAASGGIIGSLPILTMREGFSRGLLSNEAGAGTSALSHSERPITPAQAGLLGMLEVFFDTVVLCMLTAFAILLSNNGTPAASGTELLFATVGSAFGSVSGALLAFCIAAFAFSTVICWYYYGYRALSCLVEAGEGPYRVAFLFAVAIGGLVHEQTLVFFTDRLLLALVVLTALALIKNSDRLVRLSEKSGLINPRR